MRRTQLLWLSVAVISLLIVSLFIYFNKMRSDRLHNSQHRALGLVAEARLEMYKCDLIDLALKQARFHNTYGYYASDITDLNKGLEGVEDPFNPSDNTDAKDEGPEVFAKYKASFHLVPLDPYTDINEAEKLKIIVAYVVTGEKIDGFPLIGYGGDVESIEPAHLERTLEENAKYELPVGVSVDEWKVMRSETRQKWRSLTNAEREGQLQAARKILKDYDILLRAANAQKVAPDTWFYIPGDIKTKWITLSDSERSSIVARIETNFEDQALNVDGATIEEWRRIPVFKRDKWQELSAEDRRWAEFDARCPKGPFQPAHDDSAPQQAKIGR